MLILPIIILAGKIEFWADVTTLSPFEIGLNLSTVESLIIREFTPGQLPIPSAVIFSFLSLLFRISAETDKEERHFEKNIQAAREDVEPRLLMSYDRIRQNYRNGLAVVPVERDACGGCFYSIPPQKQSEIKLRKKIMVCENCGRILVDDELNADVAVK